MRRCVSLLSLYKFPYAPLVTNPVVFLDITIEGSHAGRVSVELFFDTVPKTCENFRSLCTGERSPVPSKPLYYKGTPFHRIIPGFVVQGGDFKLHDGRANESVFGYPFPDESFEGKAGKHTEGTVAMANSGPNLNGSQFFFNLTRSPHLDRKFVVFGQVIDGWDVVCEISRTCGSRCGTPVSRAWISECGQSGGLYHEELRELENATPGRTFHDMPGKEVLNALRPRF
jgi:peptidylprolyl isomerase